MRTPLRGEYARTATPNAVGLVDRHLTPKSRVTVVVVVAALLSALGAGIAVINPTILTSSRDPMNRAADVYAGYFASRNLALATALFALLVLRARPALAVMLGFTALVQFLDAIVDAVSGRLSLVPGLALLACVFGWAAYTLRGWAPTS